MYRSTVLGLLLALWGCSSEPVDVGEQSHQVAARGGKGRGKGHDRDDHGRGHGHGHHGHGHDCDGDDGDDDDGGGTDTGGTPAACTVSVGGPTVFTSIDSGFNLLGDDTVTPSSAVAHVASSSGLPSTIGALARDGVLTVTADPSADVEVTYTVCCDDAETSCVDATFFVTAPAA